MRQYVSALAAAAVLAMAQAETYTNPIIAPVAADPDVIRAEDGFYLYATQDHWGGREHYLPIFKSADLGSWEFVGDVFDLPPAWKEGGGFLWAPDISRHDGRYHLYYAYSQWGDPNPCIGLATADHPQGPWQDLGRAVFCSEDIGVRNSIDPFIWDEGGVRTMVWGSFHGIYAVRLSDDGSEAAGEKVELADRRFEAPFVHFREGYYYLFLSSGSCCEGENSTYATWVGRAESLLGPYLDARGTDLRYGGGELVLFRNDHWVGPGHNTIITDDAGADWIIYHAISPENPRLASGATRRPTLLDRIDWVEGWPVVNGGEGPSFTPRPAPVLE
jgi:arabinan endo-1,5-alpha-L-arabinosidase